MSRPAGITLAIVLVLTGCARPAPQAGVVAPASSASGPTAGHFRSAQVNGRTLVSGTAVDLRLDDGRLTAAAGCNTMSGTFTVGGSTLRVAQLAVTEMGCGADLMAQDAWMGTWLATPLTVESTGADLVLAGAGTTITFRPVANAPLEETSWRLATIGTAQGAASPVPNGVDVLVRISGGRIIANVGCNPGAGLVSADGSTLSFTMSYSMMSCPQQGWQDVQSAVAAMTEGKPVTYRIDADILTLTAPDGSLLVFTAASNTLSSPARGATPTESAPAPTRPS